MPSKLNYRISKLALKDLDKIWLYTLNKWSSSQANKYFNEIIKGINLICRNPEIGKSIDELKSNHRILKIKAHLIVYKREKNEILVDRILHENMDIKSKI